MRKDNLLLKSDSYKYSHYLQYPPDAKGLVAYVEARHNNLPYPFVVNELLFFGLQAFIKKYLLTPITMEDIDEAERIIRLHGEPFNREGFEKIVREHGGLFPVKIRAVKEGSRIPWGNVLVTVEADAPEFVWAATFIETALVRAVWYPSTVATVSRLCKCIILKYLKMTSDDPYGQQPFKLHDFGARGASSSETAAIGGLAHLVNFVGTDTVEALVYGIDYYDCPMAGFSIPAAEHSTITAWGREGELNAYRNMIRQFARPGAVVACVSDSYDIYTAAEKLWGEDLRQDVIDSGAVVVVRPDSGDPLQVTNKLVKILDERFGSTVNGKGFKVLNHVRLIQGDGVDPEIIDHILLGFKQNGYSAENIAFGMGGALLQKCNRDTFSFAMKACAVLRDDGWHEVYKAPITSPGKASKKGRLELVRSPCGQYETVREGEECGRERLLETVYDHGRLVRIQSLEDVRRVSN